MPQIFKFAIITLALLFVCGCGQKGPLILPQDADSPKQTQ